MKQMFEQREMVRGSLSVHISIYLKLFSSSEPQYHIPPLTPVTFDARELWEDVNIFTDFIFFEIHVCLCSIAMQLKLKHKNVSFEKWEIVDIHWKFIDFSMPATFQMVPLRMSVLDIEGTKTYFFKVIYNLVFRLLSSIFFSRLEFQITSLSMFVLDCRVTLSLEIIKWLWNHVLVVVLMKK